MHVYSMTLTQIKPTKKSSRVNKMKLQEGTTDKSLPVHSGVAFDKLIEEF